MAKTSGVDFIIRSAEREDAEEIVSVLRRSIALICGPYYGDNRTMIEKWCHNKTEANVIGWMCDDDNSMFVAENFATQSCIGVGLVRKLPGSVPMGEILLCYVDPDYVNRGIGKALVQAMEEEIFDVVESITLRATLNAESFYAKSGYVRQTLPSGEPPSVTMNKLRC